MPDFEDEINNAESKQGCTSRTLIITTRTNNMEDDELNEERDDFERELLDGREGDLLDHCLDVEDVGMDGPVLFDDNYNATDAALHSMKHGLQPNDRLKRLHAMGKLYKNDCRKTT